MAVKLPATLRPVADFVIHVVVGTFLFSVVLVAAPAIALVVHLIGAFGFKPEWFVSAAEGGEKTIFYLDLFLFGLFLLSETIRFIRSIWRETFNDAPHSRG